MAVPIDVESLDFSALGARDERPSPGSGFPGGPAAIGIGTAALALLMIGVITVGFLTGAMGFGPGAEPIVDAVAGMLLLLGIGALGLWYAVTALRAPRASSLDPARFERFATVNGLRYAERENFPDFAGTAFADARPLLLRHFRPAEGDDFDYGTVTFPRGQGFLQERTWGYLAVRLERSLPHLVLTTTLPRLPRRDDFERVPVARRFAQEFELRCAAGGESEARALFRVPLLVLLAARRGPFDVEVVGDRFVAYGPPFDVDDPAVHRRMLRITRLVWDRVGIVPESRTRSA